MTIRTALVVTAVLVFLYLGGITAYVVGVLSPSVTELRSRSEAHSVEYATLRDRLASLERIQNAAVRLALDDTVTPEERSEVGRLLVEARTVAEHSAGVRSTIRLSGASPAVRAALADAAGAESRWAGLIQESLDHLAGSRFSVARGRLDAADRAHVAMGRYLDQAQTHGLSDMIASERQLGAQAAQVGRTVALWAAIGTILIALAAVGIRRRLYAPLLALDAGLARVADGDLTTVLPVQRKDEVGRLTAHFNQMTEILRVRSLVDRSRQSTLVARLGRIIEHSFNEIYLFDARTLSLVQMNEGAQVGVGYTGDSYLGLTALDIISGYDEAAFRTLVEPLRSGERQRLQFSASHRRRDGSVYPVEITLQLWMTEEPAVFVAIAQDVTERLRGEMVRQASLRISELALQATSLEGLFAAIHGVVAGLMPAANFYIALYDAKEERLSFPYFVDEVDERPAPKPLGRGLTEYVLRTGAPILVTPEGFNDLVARGEVELIGAQSLDWIGVPLVAEGQTIGVFVVQSYSTATRYKPGDVEILRFVSTQIAMAIARRRAEQEVAEGRQRLQSVLDAAPYGAHLYELRPDGSLVFTGANRSADRILKVDHARLAGLPIEEAFPGLSGQKTAETYRRTAAEGTPFDADRVDYADDTIHGAFEVHAVQTAPGRIAVFFRDITERVELEGQLRRSEEHLRQAQRMESIGRLAGGVAHDFNNLLTVMLGFASQARDGLAPDHPSQADLEEVERACEKAAALTRQLLAFARRGVIAPRAIDLNEVSLAMDKMLRRLIGEDVELVTVAGNGLWSVEVDLGQIQQVIINLAVNARDAMPAGGKLTIETANVSLDAGSQGRVSGIDPGDYVMLTVSDTGYGMSEEVREHIFEPFFTTKKTGLGTGLGLATCYGIVKQAGGSIWVDSEPGQGSSFRIYLPREMSTAEPVSEAAATSTPTGREHVLLVEDDGKVRAVAVKALRDFGYTVTEAANGVDAMQVAASRLHEFDLLVTDVVMPLLGGRELVERLLERRPDLKVIYTSGYTEDGIVHDGVLDRGVEFLPKPYDPLALGRKVREVLDRADENAGTRGR